jgi:UDP-N-acetyl-D-glucosamine dehydrogenase
MRVDGGEPVPDVPLSDEVLSGCDCVVIVTDHSGIDYSKVVRLAPLIIDTRNITRKLGLPEFEEKIVRL